MKENEDIPLHKWQRVQAELDRDRKELEQARRTIEILTHANRGLAERLREAEEKILVAKLQLTYVKL